MKTNTTAPVWVGKKWELHEQTVQTVRQRSKCWSYGSYEWQGVRDTVIEFLTK